MKIKVIASVAFCFVMVASIVFTVGAERPSFSEQFRLDAEVVPEATGSYDFDVAHSAIGFKVKHMGLVDVPGFFTKFDGKVNYDAENVAKSSVVFSIDTASIDTRNERRDNHLRSKDFFNADENPKITFTSKMVEKKGDMLLVKGDLTMAGKTKEITIPVNVVGFKKGRRGGKVMGATATTKIARSDFGINYGIESGAIGDEVTIEINVEARGK